MTTILDAPLDPAAKAPGEQEAVVGLGVEQLEPDTGSEPTPPETEPDDTATDSADGSADDRVIAPVTLALTAVSAALAAGGAAWMVGGVFRGAEARLVGFLGVLLGAGLVYLGIRFRMRVATYLVLPAALVLGAVLMSSASGAGTSSLPSLVRDAATSSTVLQPPIDFAPGWRLILLVLLALATSSGLTLALSLNKPRLAVAVPTPLTVAAALIQPGSTAIITSAISVGFVMMALATSYAAEGVGDTFDRRFETRRLLRSAIAGLLFVIGLILASKVSFLFPTSDPHRVIPPRRPPVSPPQPDVPLYTVKGTPPGPLRVGVIDVYDVKEQAWLLPPVDNQRLVRLHLPADVPDAPPPSGKQVQLSITVQQAKGHLLPSLAGMRRVEGSTSVDDDPRSQTLTLSERPVYTGLTYTVDANPNPTGTELSKAPATVPATLKQFLTAPPVPPAVQSLLDKAPKNLFGKMQYLRAALYKNFIAVGDGKPTDVSADRVVHLLTAPRGQAKGNPYELTASEALLARWAGVPARIGFGYYNGTPKPGGVTEFRPTNAATYLEVYFAPYGWVPIVGTPPRAQQSLSNNQHNNDPNIQPSPELGINVYLPIRQNDRIPLYVYARYYLVRALPIFFGFGLLLLLYPLALKRLRRRRRLAWAAAHGPAAAIAVAYCDLRDKMIDLALPGRGMTPLELVEVVDEDEEHSELGWLVTRGLWGDLRHDLTDVDAVFARRLSDSVSSRLAKAQPETARLLAAVSRASLKSPYSREVPNVWWRLRLRERMPRLRRPRWSSFIRVVRRLRPGVATSVLAVLAVIGLGGCSASATAHADPVVAFPTRLAPPIVGGLQTKEEPVAEQQYVKNAGNRNVLVSQGKVLSFNRNGLIQAALQVAQLKPGYATTSADVVKAITGSIGDGGNDVKQLRSEGTHSLWAQTDGSQRIFLWFPTAKAMAMLVVRAEISEGASEAMARGLIDYGDGGTINERALAAALSATPAGTQPTVGQSGQPPAGQPPVVAPSPSTSTEPKR